MKKIGWIGLGDMGRPMVQNLLKAKYEVTVYNRSEEKTVEVVAAGAKKVNSPKEAIAAAEVIFVMLSEGSAIDSVFKQEKGILEAALTNKIIVDMSTISPEETKTFANLVSEKGGKYVDAPVSGSVGAAIGAQLLVLAGGEKEVVESCREYFEVVGREMIYFGGTGMGSSAKLTINTLLGIMTQGFSEVMYFGETMGLEKTLITEMISKSAMNNGLFQGKKDSFLTETFAPAFKLELMTKDLRLSNEAAESKGLQLPLANMAAKTYKEANDSGKGKLDMAAIYSEIKEKSK